MARSIWKGSLSFGLVNIPVKLTTAQRQKDVHFNQLHAKDGGRIRYKKFCAIEQKEVPSEEIVKGYEVTPDHYVTFSDEELEAADPERTHTIDIVEFVDLASIDPIFYDAQYYLVPEKTAAKPYALFLQALDKQDKVAIGRFVFHTKENLVAVRAKEGLLVLSTLLFGDEVVKPSEVEEDVKIPKASPKEVAMAEQLIEALSGEFDPTKYKDEHRERLLALIERKAQGKQIVVEPVEAPATKATDLMAALEASLKAVKKKGHA